MRQSLRCPHNHPVEPAANNVATGYADERVKEADKEVLANRYVKANQGQD